MIANCVINSSMCKRKVSNFFIFLFLYFHLQPKKASQNAERVTNSLLFVSGEKQFSCMNVVRVSTVIVSSKPAASVDCIRRSIFFRLPICDRQIVCGPYFGVQ